jgi:hypothetical protein
MGDGQSEHPTPEIAAALVRALGLEPSRVVLDSVKLTPWASRSSLVTCQVVQVLTGTQAEVLAMLEVGEPLQFGEW